jgi:hypothetical protein
MSDDDNNLVQQGAAMLREAINSSKVTLNQIRRERDTDAATVRAREHWGDINDEQRLITRGIKLRIAARDLVLESSSATSKLKG